LGRKDDLIVCPDGRLIFSPIIIGFMRWIPGIAHYRFVQESLTKLRIDIVKDENFSEQTLEQIVEEVRKLTGEGIEIVPVLVDKIERERTGKLRTVISKVSKPKVLIN
jgi:phenylacetate-CoA ligase